MTEKIVFFDVNEPDNQPIVEYLKTKSFLICDPSGSTRTSVKKLLTQMGVPLNSIELAEEYQSSQSIIEEKHSQFVFSCLNFYKNTGLELLEVHKQILPNRLEGAFFIIAKNNAPENTTIPFEYDIDGLVTCPYTVEELQDIILNAIKIKMNPSEYEREICAAKQAETQGDIDKTLEHFMKAKECSESPIFPVSMIGRIHYNKKNTDEAKKYFEEGLTYDPINYICASRLYELYKEEKSYENAYRMIKILSDNYPIDLAIIPEYTRICIASSHFDDVLAFSDLLLRENSAEANKIKSPVAAGLVMSGRALLDRSDTEKAKKVFEQSAKLSQGNEKILENILKHLLKFSEVDFAQHIISEYAKDGFNCLTFDYMIYSLHTKEMSDDEKLAKGKDLIGRGVKEIQLYQEVISAMEALHLSLYKIEEVVFEAGKNFPAYQKELDARLEEYKNKKAS